MKKVYFLVVFIICSITIIIIPCRAQVISSSNELPQSINKFAFKLFKEINTEEGAKNLFISPCSISLALGMTANGAVGETQESMRKAIEMQGIPVDSIKFFYNNLIYLLSGVDTTSEYYNSVKRILSTYKDTNSRQGKRLKESFIDEISPAIKFNIVNSIWYRNSFKINKSFLDICTKYYYSSANELDFNDPSATDRINRWVTEKTNGTIKKIINSINPSDVMLLINTLYFKADWSEKFDENKTNDGVFYKSYYPEYKIICKMMHDTNSNYCYEESGLKALGLSYRKGTYSMYIFLPDSGKNIDEFIAALNDKNWNKCMNSFEKAQVNLTMPKFKYNYDISMKKTLTKLGMNVAFSSDLANFDSISISKPLFIGDVIHQTFINVTEKGTEAAAITYVNTRGAAMPEKEKEFNFVLDHPFVFVIRENRTGTIIFMGKVVEPVY